MNYKKINSCLSSTLTEDLGGESKPKASEDAGYTNEIEEGEHKKRGNKMLTNYFDNERDYASDYSASTIQNAAGQAIEYISKLYNEKGVEAMYQAIRSREKEINKELSGNLYVFTFETEVLRYAKSFAFDLSIIWAINNPACKETDAYKQAQTKKKKEGETR